jgi:hypothetical protein
MEDGGPQPVPDASVADVVDDATVADVVDDAPTSDASVHDAVIQDVRIEDVLVADVAADSSPSIGPCRGPAPAPVQCDVYSDAACGPFGSCNHYDSQSYWCCGAAFACCSSPADCCGQECIGGTCSSAGQPCSTDADCNNGTLCLQGVFGRGVGHGVCLKWPGSACNVAIECTSYGCDGGGCTCGYQYDVCRTDADCCVGICVQGSCDFSGEGGRCSKDSDCSNGACVGGQCQCIPAGSPAAAGPSDHCCSRGELLGVCIAQGGGHSGCTTRVPDCYGGACVNGTCARVGPTGYCNVDSECCARATACVQGRCVAEQ